MTNEQIKGYDKDEFKNYLRVGFEDDDSVIESFYHGAEWFLCTAVSKHATPEQLYKYEQFKPAVILLAAFWYNAKLAVQQTATVKANTDEIPFGVSMLIVQLQARYFNDFEFSEQQDRDTETKPS